MKANLNFELKEGQRLAVALSGGEDSVALLHFLLNANLPFEIVAITVNHMIRGEEAGRDEEFVVNLCSQLKVPLKIFKKDVPSIASSCGLGIEAAARAVRYQCFSHSIKEKFCDAVATAHHMSDDVETALLNLFRGSGLKGVSGMGALIMDGCKIYRPFLNVSKEEIDDYVVANNLKFVTDSTNYSSDYSRNFLRLKVLPLIKEKFPESERAIKRFMLSAAEDDELLTRLSLKYLKGDSFKAKILTCKDKPLFFRAFKEALKLLGIERDYEKIHVDCAYALQWAKRGKKLDLKGATAIKEEGEIALVKKKDMSCPPASPLKEGLNVFGKFKFTAQYQDYAGYAPEKGELYLDADACSTLFVRGKREGDRFLKFGGHLVKLKDFMGEKKIPFADRNLIPLLVDKEDRICAVVGYEINKEVKADENTKRILKIKLL